MENYFYIITDKYSIQDISNCKESDRTIDLSVSKLYENKELLCLLHLINFKSFDGFCNYISAFGSKKEEDRFLKLKSDIEVRILITDAMLLEKVKQTLH